jgi:hypothetical protein
MMIDGKMVDRGSAPVPCPEKSVAYYRHDGFQAAPAPIKFTNCGGGFIKKQKS